MLIHVYYCYLFVLWNLHQINTSTATAIDISVKITAATIRPITRSTALFGSSCGWVVAVVSDDNSKTCPEIIAKSAILFSPISVLYPTQCCDIKLNLDQ